MESKVWVLGDGASRLCPAACLGGETWKFGGWRSWRSPCVFSPVESPQEILERKPSLLRAGPVFPSAGRSQQAKKRKENFESLHGGKLPVTALAQYASNGQREEHGMV